MNATATIPTVKRYFAGEHTTTWSKATGLCPNRTCGCKHRTLAAAEKCSYLAAPREMYAELSDGVVVRAYYLLGMESRSEASL